MTAPEIPSGRRYPLSKWAEDFQKFYIADEQETEAMKHRSNITPLKTKKQSRRPRTKETMDPLPPPAHARGTDKKTPKASKTTNESPDRATSRPSRRASQPLFNLEEHSGEISPTMRRDLGLPVKWRGKEKQEAHKKGDLSEDHAESGHRQTWFQMSLLLMLMGCVRVELQSCKCWESPTQETLSGPMSRERDIAIQHGVYHRAAGVLGSQMLE